MINHYLRDAHPSGASSMEIPMVPNPHDIPGQPWAFHEDHDHKGDQDQGTTQVLRIPARKPKKKSGGLMNLLDGSELGVAPNDLGNHHHIVSCSGLMVT